MAAPSVVVQPRRWPRYLLIGAISFLILAILSVGGGYLYLKWRFSQIHKTDISGLAPDSGLLNVLLVGSDSRANVSGVEAQQTGKNLVSGQRSDTIMILHADTTNKKGLGQQTEQVESQAGLREMFGNPGAVTFLTQRTHEPGGLEITGRHQEAGRCDDDGGQRPQSENRANHGVEYQAVSPTK